MNIVEAKEFRQNNLHLIGTDFKSRNGQSMERPITHLIISEKKTIGIMISVAKDLQTNEIELAKLGLINSNELNVYVVYTSTEAQKYFSELNTYLTFI